jgi:hypothetical protein
MPKRGGYRRRPRRNTRRPKSRPNIVQTKFPSVMGMSVPQMAKYGALGYNILKGLINSELKRFDLTTTNAPTSSGNIVPLSDVAQGDDAENRDGNKLMAKYLRFQWFATINGSATATLVRCIIFVDTENQGVTPTITLLLQSPTSPGNLTSPINTDQTQRFTILHDQRLSLNTGGVGIAERNVYKNLNFHINYTDGTATSRNKNSIWVAFISNESTNTPSIGYSSRLAFYDN